MPPSRLPVVSGAPLQLKENTVENVRSQILTGSTSGTQENATLTKEKLLSLSHGIVKDEDQRSIASEELGADYLANPVRWENNAARKQLDMQWHFTCGPLRIPQHAGKRHWDRLHADNVAAIPQPGGGVHVMTSRIPHKSDAELEAEVEKVIGYSSKAKPRAQLPPLPTQRPPSTPTLRQILEENTTKPLPKRPPSLAAQSHFTDGSSAFSRTTVSHATRKRTTIASSSAVGGAKAESTVGPSTVVSRASGASSRRGGGGTSVSAASKKSSAESLLVDLERERTKQRDLATELREAAMRLEALESILGKE